MTRARTLRPGLGVRVRVPASSANLGPGFDTIGLALGVHDDYEVRLTGDALVIDVEGEGAADVPRGPDHLVHRRFASTLRMLGVEVPAGLRLRCTNRVPHSRGMGSSATAIVAGISLALALDALDRTGAATLDLELVNELAAQAEGHPDNSSASTFGRLTLSWSEQPPALSPVRTAVLDVHPDVEPVVLVPDVQLATATARAALPDHVSLKDASLDAGRAALLVEALTRRPDLLLPATRDFLHQEQRRGAYPHTMELVDDLRAEGRAAVVSGAGPTVLVLATRDDVDALRRRPLPAGWRVLTPGIPRQGVVASAVTDAAGPAAR